MPLATTSWDARRPYYGGANSGNRETPDGSAPETPGAAPGAPPPPPPGAPPDDPMKKAAYAKLRTAYRNVFGANRAVTDQELESHLAGRYDDETVRRAIATIVNSEEAGTYGSTPGTKPTAYARLKAAYQQYLGRPGSEQEYEGHLNGRYDISTVEYAVSQVANSPEAEKYTASGGTGTAEGGTAGGGTREDRDKLTWSSNGRMLGFAVNSDYGGDLKARNSVKNTFGRIASRYPNTPEGLKQLVNDADFKRYFPNATLVPGGAGDKINFGGVKADFEEGAPVYEVDVLVNADPTANSADGWAWQPSGGASAAPPTPPPGPQTAQPRGMAGADARENRRGGAWGGGSAGSPWSSNFYNYLQSQQRLNRRGSSTFEDI